MTALFSKPKAPPPPEPPPVIDQQARDQIERDALRRRKGRKATILTGASGATPQTASKTLLGS